ncbi:MAG: tetratricopeptide repeat protein [Verrucomicrobiota bacterium]
MQKTVMTVHLRHIQAVAPRLLRFHWLCALSLCAAVAASANNESIPVRPRAMTQEELDLWNDPAFQRQFAQSYIAETEIEPRISEDERETMQKAMQMIADEKLDEAAELLKKNMDETSSAVFDFTLGNLYFQRDELDQAVPHYEQAADKYPKFRRAWKNLALIHVRKANYADALPALTKTIELGGGGALIYGLLGFSYSSVENHLAAESAYRMAILLDPETMDWKMGLFKQESYARAAELCANLLANDPERADLWMLQANAYIGLKKPLEAAKNYEFIDRLGKSTSATLNMLGDIYINEKLFNMAVHSYVRAMQQDDADSPARPVRAAKVLAARSAFDQTQTLISEIKTSYADSMPDDVRKDLLKLEVRIAVARDAGDEEARVLEEIVELDPLDGEALILLGQYHRRKENPEKAIFYFERAASIEDYKADANLRHAQLLVSQEKYDEALPLLRSAQQINPRDDVQKYLEQVERVAKGR